MGDLKTIRQLFDRAVELPAAERTSFLSQHCGEDEALRRQVELLLAMEEETGGFLDEPLARLPQGSPSLSAGEPEEVGPYRLLGILGRGGMGVVYRGRHRETGEEVALKTIDLPDARLLSGLRQEVRALSALKHPGIVRIVEAGLDAERPWYAMEIVEGVALSRYVPLPGAGPGVQTWWTASLTTKPREEERGEEMTVVEALSLVHRLCGPLAYIHGEGVVHRDLKPGNVIITPRGDPVLVDFGLVGRLAVEMSREPLQAAGGEVIGTFPYLSPEQTRGEIVDARADLYAVGCILYELLTGRTPFVADSPAVLVRMHREVEPDPPSRHRAGITPELDRLVLALLAKHPPDRIGYAVDLAAALEELGARATEAAGPSCRNYLYRPRLAGRSEALSELEALLKQLGEGRGDFALVGGESGVGKTRLLTELGLQAAARGVRVVVGECRSTVGREPTSALQPLRGLLQAVADRCRELGRDETARLLGTHRRILAPYESTLRSLTPAANEVEPPPLPPTSARLRLHGKLSETLLALARPRPLLLVLDDLQWADELSLEFLRFFVRDDDRRHSTLLLIGTYRTDELTPGLQELVEAARPIRIDLERLSEGSVGEMVSDMLAMTPPPEELVGFLAHESEGIPLFVAEYLRAAADEGILTRSAAGRWMFAPSRSGLDARLALPTTLQALIGRRLEDLEDEQRVLVDLLSLVRGEVNEALLASVVAEDEGDLLRPVSELMARQMIERGRKGGLRLVHHKIAEVGSDLLSVERRAQLHRQWAEALERAGRGEDEEGVVAHHWEAAGELDRAAPHYLRGARWAMNRHALDEAKRLYCSYLDLQSEPTAEALQARFELAEEVLRLSGRAAESEFEHRRIVEDARSLGDRRAEALSTMRLGVLRQRSGRSKQAGDLYERALEMARELSDPRLEANALGSLGLYLFARRDLEGAGRLLEQSLTLVREIDDPRGEVGTLSNLANLHAARGEPRKARSCIEEALAIASREGTRVEEAQALATLACLVMDEGEREESLALFEAALAVVREVGLRELEGIIVGNLAVVREELGQLREARRLHEQALMVCRETGDRRSQGHALSHLAKLELDDGEVERARIRYEAALAIACEVEDRFSEGRVRGGLARLERLTGGDLERAARLADDGIAMLAATGDRVEEAMLVCERGMIAADRSESAQVHLERAEIIAGEVEAGPSTPLGRSLDALRKRLSEGG